MRLSSLLSIGMIILFISCEKKYIPRETISVTIHKKDSVKSSVRALQKINDSLVVFASSNGEVGFVSSTLKIIKKYELKYADSLAPNFRSVAYNNESVFALSIATPALLYEIKNDAVTLRYKNEDTSAFFDALKFSDYSNAIAMGDPKDSCIQLLKTSDAGESWNLINCNMLPKTFEGEAAFAASNSTIKTINNHTWIATGGMKSRIFYSNDNHASWEVFETPVLQGTTTTGIYTMDFYNEKQGIICGGDYLNKFNESSNKALTFDGGKTWELVATNEIPTYVSCVKYIPETQGNELIAVSTNGVFYSKDKGFHWVEISKEPFYAIEFNNRNEAWLSGNGVLAYLTIH